MLTLPSSVKIHLATQPTDMRRGFDGLAGCARQLVGHEGVYSGHLFIFYGRSRDRLKILFWDRGGFVLYSKRLERKRFPLPPIEKLKDKSVLEISASDLAMLLDGIAFSEVKRQEHWTPRLSA